MTEPLSLRRRLALSINRKLQEDAIEQHRLRQLFWECTLRCNLSCRHCGSDCRVTSSIQDMPMEDFGRVLDSIARSENPHEVMINVTGGEPLMRADLEQCGRMMYDKGFPWGMVSNGFALTEKRYLSLLSSGLRAMTISLDGIGETHEWMRGREGSFERASRAIKMVIDSAEIEFDVVTCVNRRSYPQLAQIKESLIGLGLKEWRLFTVFPVGRAAEDPQLQLSREEFRGLMDFIRDTRREGRIKASYGCEGFLGNYEGDFWETMKVTSGTAFSSAARASAWAESLPTGLYRHAPASGPIITRAISTRTTLWKSGITVSSLTGTAPGPRRSSLAPLVRCGSSAGVAACT